jgi:hypothetical protein
VVHSPAHGGRAARADASHGPVMGGVELLPVLTGVVRPVPLQQLCEVDGHDDDDEVRSRWSGIGQGIEGVAALSLADLGDVEVAQGVLQRAVAEIGADLEDGGTAF